MPSVAIKRGSMHYCIIRCFMRLFRNICFEHVVNFGRSYEHFNLTDIVVLVFSVGNWRPLMATYFVWTEYFKQNCNLYHSTYTHQARTNITPETVLDFC